MVIERVVGVVVDEMGGVIGGLVVVVDVVGDGFGVDGVGVVGGCSFRRANRFRRSCFIFDSRAAVVSSSRVSEEVVDVGVGGVVGVVIGVVGVLPALPWCFRQYSRVSACLCLLVRGFGLLRLWRCFALAVGTRERKKGWMATLFSRFFCT